jgi:hypothetical protein
MDERELIDGINHCFDIASNYEESWGLIVFEKLLERFLLGDRNNAKINQVQGEILVDSQYSGKTQPNIQRLSELIGIETQQLLEVYGFEGDYPVIKQYDLQGGSKAQQARELCGLYLLACNIAYSREVVSIKELSNVVERWSVYDRSNFSRSHIGQCEWFHKSGKEVKLLLKARPEIASIVKRILGMDIS